ncbi:FAD-dependent oxidoreductase [Immundisolibacter sp.]|uniref:FAD-dependent oxidoreductase n=1 Tax=Immundisolibacter sp. TaxID=1934948 RepID=UPI003568DCC1
MTDSDVVIVGGGITGAAAAVALAGAGARVTLLDRQAPPAPAASGAPLDLRVSAIHAAAAAWLTHLGAWPLVPASHRSPFGSIQVWDAGSRGRIGFDSADLGQPWLGHIVENRALVAALHARLAALPTARLRAPARLEDWRTDEHGVHLRLEDGSHLHARLLVGADGADSPLRLGAGIASHDTPYGQCAVVCNVGTERPHDAIARQRFLATGPLAFLPLADGRSAVVWSTTTDAATRLAALPEAQFAQELEAAFEGRLGAVTTVGERAVLPLRGRLAERYVGPRLALLGDAAHVVHPMAGLGANLGLGDAAQLARIVSDALRAGRDPGAADGLLRYQRTRRAQNLPVVQAIGALHRLFGATAAPLRALRGAGLRLTDHAAPLKRALTAAACGLDDTAFDH